MKKIIGFFLFCCFQILTCVNASSIPEKWVETVDALVVGAGGAGLSAALSASENGAFSHIG